LSIEINGKCRIAKVGKDFCPFFGLGATASPGWGYENGRKHGFISGWCSKIALEVCPLMPMTEAAGCDGHMNPGILNVLNEEVASKPDVYAIDTDLRA
jgi:hypothetical protein